MALGRGLGALITSTGGSKQRTPEPETGSHEKIWNIPLAAISPNAGQPRKHFNPAELEELAASVKEHGILQPVLVTEKTDGGYEIVSGERRWRAAKIAGLSSVPAIIKKLADRQKLEVSLIENIQREDLNPIEEAFAYQRLMEEFKLTQQEVAQKVGKSRPAVANTLRLLELPEEIKTALIDKKINMGQARALLALEDSRDQLEMLSSMLGHKITVRELEKGISKRNPVKNKARRDPNLAYLEDKMRAALGTKVSVTQKGERGTIVIDYYSKEELSRLIKKISD